MTDTDTRGQQDAQPSGRGNAAGRAMFGTVRDQFRTLLPRAAGTVLGNWQFAIVLAAAAVIRLVVMLGYRPILWFNDSYIYYEDAVSHIPDYVRSNGYPFFLYLLLDPARSMVVVAMAQAGMGLAMGIAIYAVLRHRGLAWYWAALPALPVLFDVFELQLEHLVASDILFTFLVVLALALCCWNDRPSVPALAIAGLLTGYATVVRGIGEPLLILFLIALLARRAGVRRLTALAIGGVLPIGAYMIWAHHSTGKYALTESTGAFLYSRVSTFAECDRIKPPARLRVFCDSTPPRYRPQASEYIWADVEGHPAGTGPYRNTPTPLARLYGPDNSYRFTPYTSAQLSSFARRAILAQPLDYLRVVADDVVHTFGWRRAPDPEDVNGNGADFRFGATAPAMPGWAHRDNGILAAYLGPKLGQPVVERPWSGFIQQYQRFIYLPGTVLAIIVLAGLAGLLRRWRTFGGIGLLPWLTGVLLIVGPPLTAGFSYRYVVAAVPACCLAAGLAFTGRDSPRGSRAAPAPEPAAQAGPPAE